jgi:hypothetical protein
MSDPSITVERTEVEGELKVQSVGPGWYWNIRDKEHWVWGEIPSDTASGEQIVLPEKDQGHLRREFLEQLRHDYWVDALVALAIRYLGTRQGEHVINFTPEEQETPFWEMRWAEGKAGEELHLRLGLPKTDGEVETPENFFRCVSRAFEERTILKAALRDFFELLEHAAGLPEEKKGEEMRYLLRRLVRDTGEILEKGEK